MTKQTPEFYASDADSWPEPDLRGHKIEGERYTSAAFMEQEWEGMWTKTWLLLGREDEIPEAGDYQVEDVGRESVIMVRQRDGGIKAFYNVCQHRGAKMLFTEDGTVGDGDIVCPYHGWKWDTDGSLNWVQDPEDFPQGDPCGKLRLEEMHCDSFAGFIWINMDPDCMSLKDYLGPLWDEWSAYEIDHWKRYVALSANVPCNWKIVLDNFNESYHLPTVHPQAAAKTEESYKYTQFDMAPEGHARMWMRSQVPSHQLLDKGEPLMNPSLAAMLEKWELDPEEFKGREFETREAIQKQMRVLGPQRGLTHFDNLKDHQLTDVYHYFLFPNFAVSLWAEGFHFLRARPHPTDPTKCLFDNWWYSPAPEGMTEPASTIIGPVERDAEVEHDVFEYGERSLSELIDQDMGVTTGQQLGFRSRAYKGVYLAHQEHRIRRYHEVVDDYIEGRRPAAKFHKQAAE